MIRRLTTGSLSSDEGAAVLEFVVLAVVLLIPIVYAVVTVASLHSATFGSVTAAREAARAYVTADTTTSGAARARKAAEIAMADQGFAAPEVSIRCLDGACLSPGSRVRVEVSAQVALPFMPGDGSGGARIPVTAVYEQNVDTYRETS